MARKKKSSRSKRSKARSPEEIARAAGEHLRRERYKDAAADYKQLLKGERRPEWIEGLADAYAGRAAQLAARGMVKEAIALWQNRAEACDKSLADPRYLQWLIAADRTAEIAYLYRQDAAALSGADGLADLQARLAAAALADGGALIEQLSADDPVARDFAAADAALRDYTAGDDEALQAALARIPFRSPYRDFRQLLKALLRYETDPAGGAPLIARIPADTPFAGVMKALEIAGQLGSASSPEATTLANLADGVQALLADLAGWHSSQRQLLSPLAQLSDAPSEKARFNFVIAHRRVLGQEYARVSAFVLAGDDARLHRRLFKIYGTLPEAEGARLMALAFETSGMPWDAVDQWQRAADAMAAETAPDSDHRLRRALIHRHIADLIQPPSASLPLAPEVVDQLTTSLKIDPADRDSALRLLDHYLYIDDLKTARGWVDQVLAQFPEDPGCLLKAAEVATAGKAYKKAARFAERVLAVDPINVDARGLLVDAHLGHARKQIQSKKPDAARREAKHAAGFARSVVDTTRVALVDAFATFIEDGAQAAGAALVSAVGRAGDPLVGRFLLLLEAGRAGLNLTAADRAAGLPAIKQLADREHVLALIDVLGALRPGQQHKASAEAALKKLSPALNQAASARLARGRAEQVCEMLLRYRQYGPLKRYAQSALKRWRNDPLFVFYRIMGDKRGERILPWDREIGTLEAAADRARDAGDQRTAERIGATLDDMLPPLTEFGDFDPFDNAMPPEPSPKSVPPPLIDGELNPMLREMFAQFLDSAELDRLEAAIKRDEPVPDDIAQKMEALIGKFYDDDDGLPPPQQQRQSGSRNRRSGRHDENQGDLFGDDL